MTEYVTDVCSQCGGLRSVCGDPDRPLYPQRSTCYVTATAQAVDRRTRDFHGHPDPETPAPHFTDGMSVWMSQYDLTPEDDFGGALALSPDQQALGDEHEAADGEQQRRATQDARICDRPQQG